jgi:hypothetical protein
MPSRLTLWQHTKEMWRKNKAKLLVAVFGAGLVIMSFAIKDDYREKVKARGDAIEAAENTFIMRAESERIYNLVGHARHSTDIFLPPSKGAETISNKAILDTWFWIDRAIIDADHNEIQGAAVTVDNIERLAKELPASDATAIRSTLSTIHADMTNFETDWSKYDGFKMGMSSYSNDSQFTILRNKSGSGKEFSEYLNGYLSAAAKVDGSCTSILNKIQNLEVDALHRASEAIEQTERKYNEVNAICYLVTFIGALFTILGVFLGFEPHIEIS